MTTMLTLSQWKIHPAPTWNTFVPISAIRACHSVLYSHNAELTGSQCEARFWLSDGGRLRPECSWAFCYVWLGYVALRKAPPLTPPIIKQTKNTSMLRTEYSDFAHCFFTSQDMVKPVRTSELIIPNITTGSSLPSMAWTSIEPEWNLLRLKKTRGSKTIPEAAGAKITI